MKLKYFILLFVLIIPLSGCVIPSDFYGMAVDPRNISQHDHDIYLEYQVSMAILNDRTTTNLKEHGMVEIHAFYGQVFIAGEYDTKAQESKAMALARNVPGVSSVKAYLLPRQEGKACKKPSKFGVRMALQSASEVHSTNMKVGLVQCDIVLFGIVTGTDEADRAIAAAKTVKDVSKVVSFLMIPPEKK